MMPSSIARDSKMHMKTQWEREEVALVLVSPVWRLLMPLVSSCSASSPACPEPCLVADSHADSHCMRPCIHSMGGVRTGYFHGVCGMHDRPTHDLELTQVNVLLPRLSILQLLTQTIFSAQRG